MDEMLGKARELTLHATPLAGDCGRLCNAACCKGDENAGMRLFPGEEELYRGVDGFEVRERGDGRGFALVCGGQCNRAERPLACRLFPLFPMVSRDDVKIGVSIVKDVRAVGCCAIVRGGIKLDRGFVRAVRRAAKRLVQSPEMLEYLLAESTELEEIIALADIL